MERFKEAEEASATVKAESDYFTAQAGALTYVGHPPMLTVECAEETFPSSLGSVAYFAEAQIGWHQEARR